MTDFYSDIADRESERLERLASTFEHLAVDPQQQRMRRDYLRALNLHGAFRALEVGCGTGAVLKRIAVEYPEAQLFGIDLSAFFLQEARRTTAANIRFLEGDARELPFAAAEFDAVIFHSTLRQIAGSELALTEAFRVLRSGGRLAIFDADYTLPGPLDGGDTLVQRQTLAVLSQLARHTGLAVRLSEQAVRAGFRITYSQSYSYRGNAENPLLPTLFDAAVDRLWDCGRIDGDFAAAMKVELRRRLQNGSLPGRLTYVSLVAVKKDFPGNQEKFYVSA